MESKKRQEEFLKYFLPNKERLSRFARAMCANNEDAKDLVSDTIISVYENFGRIKHRDAFLSYIFTTASRIYKRKLWRNKFFGLFKEAEAEKIISTDLSPELQFDIDILYKLLESLPKKQREALVLFEISGLTLEEIRKIQGGTLSGIKSRLKRGRDSLTKLLTDKEQYCVTENKHDRKNGKVKYLKPETIVINLKVQNE